MALQVADSFSGTGVRHFLGLADDLYVGSAVRSVSSDDIAISAVGRFHFIKIDGDVFGANSGIFIDQSGSDAGSNGVTIGQTGQLSAIGGAIRLTGAGNNVLNYGEVASVGGRAITISNGGDGVARSKIINYGSISANSEAIYTGGNGVVIRNYGDITSAFGVSISSGIGDDLVRNFGTIDGNLDLSDGVNIVINRGLIVGDIDTGAGGDTIDNTGGTITGEASLGDGLDIYKPGAGDDAANGGLGSDYLNFTRSSGVQFALDGSLAATGWAMGDTFTGFENLDGSLTGADVLVGDGGSNSIFGNGGDDTLTGLAGIDTLFGGLGNDKLDGGTGDDNVYGGTGNDNVMGGIGNDQILGQDGNDTISGGAGRDSVSGNLGADRFVFAAGDFAGRTNTTADRILDFAQAEADQIDLKLVDAKSAVAGDQAFAFIGTAAFHNVAGELRFVQGASSTVVQGDTNGDGVADFWITLSGSIALKVADFVL